MRNRRHTWLFSFTDTAFLLLLVYTQFGRLNAEAPVAEMRLPAPVVVNNPELAALKPERDYRQVLVEKHSDKPYRLVRIIGGNEAGSSGPLDFVGLRNALLEVACDEKGGPRPVVVPLPESFSSDLLQATALVGRLWCEGGGAVVHRQRESGPGGMVDMGRREGTS